MSPLTLRRRYLPRGGRPPKTHQAAAAQAARSQAQPPQAHSRLEIKTAIPTNADGNIKLTRFKPGFERETEDELALAFSRPSRLFKEDSPFYPSATQTCTPCKLSP